MREVLRLKRYKVSGPSDSSPNTTTHVEDVVLAFDERSERPIVLARTVPNASVSPYNIKITLNVDEFDHIALAVQDLKKP